MKEVVEFNFELPDGSELPFTCKCEVNYREDNNYGSDSDGGRGCIARLVTDVEIIKISNWEDVDYTRIIKSEHTKEDIKEQAVDVFYGR